MALKQELPDLVGQLSSIMGPELAEQIVQVAVDATGNEIEAQNLIVEGLSDLTFEQRTQMLKVIDSYKH